jgi:hypothetical protein
MSADLELVETRLRTAMREAAAQVDAAPAFGAVRPSPSVRRRPALRHLVAGFAGVVAVAIAAGVAVRLGDRDDAGTAAPREVPSDELSSSEADVSILMLDDATRVEIAAVREAILRTPKVAGFAFVDGPALFEELEPPPPVSVDPEALPVLFRLDLATGVTAETVAAEFRDLAGVHGVATRLAPSGPMSEPVQLQPEQLPHFAADLAVFMTVSPTAEQIDAVRELVVTSREVGYFTYVDKQTAYDEFSTLFRDKPDLVAETTPEALPPSFRLVIDDRGALERLRASFESMPGVDVTVTPSTFPLAQ